MLKGTKLCALPVSVILYRKSVTLDTLSGSFLLSISNALLWFEAVQKALSTTVPLCSLPLGAKARRAVLYSDT